MDANTIKNAISHCSNGYYYLEGSMRLFPSATNRRKHSLGVYIPRPYRRVLDSIGIDQLDKPLVIVNFNLPKYARLAIALHEDGHHICHQSECSCFGYRTLEEKHAHMWMLEKLLEMRAYRSLAWAIRLIEGYSRVKALTRGAGVYHRSGVLVRKTPLWREACFIARKSGFLTGPLLRSRPLIPGASN
jgi:hypothetical protein